MMGVRVNGLPKGACYRGVVVAACVEGRNVYVDTTLRSAKITSFVQITFE